MGAYTYEKRAADTGEPIHVMVYLLEVESDQGKWPEKNERRREWLQPREAAERVDEPGLMEIIRRLDIGPLDA